MKTESRPLLGLCPMGKFVFSHEDAILQKDRIRAKLSEWKVRFTDLEGVLPDGLVRDQKHVEAVVRHFQAAGVDALFLPHCNFGTEGAAGMIARRLGVPVLLWGPRDEAPMADGRRLRDSLCGLLATSKVLHKLGMTFTYIENCRTEELPLREGVDCFVRAVNVARVFRKGVRIGQLGQRIDFFWTTISNESELLERFRVEVQPLDLVTFIRRAKERVARDRSRYAAEAQEISRAVQLEEFPEIGPFLNVLAVRDEMLALAEEHGLEGLAIQDFTSLVDEMGAYCFYANSMVSEKLAVGMETDLHGALSTLFLQRVAMGREPSWLAEFTVRHPQNENGVLLWHAGAPLSMCHPKVKARIGHHWILPSPLSGMPHFRLKDGPLTVTRFDGDHGEYRLAIGEGRTVDGPETLNNYVWMEVNDWPRWERQLIQSSMIHHIGMAYGRFGEALAEACRYVPGLEPLRLGGASDSTASFER